MLGSSGDRPAEGAELRRGSPKRSESPSGPPTVGMLAWSATSDQRGWSLGRQVGDDLCAMVYDSDLSNRIRELISADGEVAGRHVSRPIQAGRARQR